jgi:hypothetical protein
MEPNKETADRHLDTLETTIGELIDLSDAEENSAVAPARVDCTRGTRLRQMRALLEECRR